MKIVFLKGRLATIGGLETATRRLMTQFVQKGHEVTLLTTGSLTDLPEGMAAISLGEEFKLTFRHLLAFDRACQSWLNKHSADVIFGMERNSYQTHFRAGGGVHAAFLKQRIYSCSLFKRLTFPFNPQHRLILDLEKKCLQNPRLQRIFANSEMVKREMMEHYGTPDDKITVVHNGAPLIEWKETFETSLKREREGPFRFLFVGSGYRRKGLLFLLEALTLLKQEEFHLDVVGKEKEETLFRWHAERLGLGKQVTFHGQQKRVLPFYAASDCLVIPSLYDPFANVTTEGLAMGLFVLTSRFNGGHEIVTPENGAIIEAIDDRESFALTLKKALSHPKTAASAQKIRESIFGLDISSQLEIIVHKTLENK